MCPVAPDGRQAAAGSATPDPALVARLARLGVTLGTATADGPPGPTRPDVAPIELAVPGQVLEGPDGSVYVSVARFAADDRHGGEPLSSLTRSDPEALARLMGLSGPDGIDVSRTVFLDLETTGLSLGAGAYAFLIGAGRFVGTTFQVRQLFLRDPSEEPAQLTRLAEWLDGCSAVVTFNGRSFDVPMLEGRLAMHRRPPAFSSMAHFDLLHTARRVWRLRLGGCSLQALERSVLGFEREDDVPGWLVPERYSMYLRTGDARPLVGVFKHNELDILTMVSLASRLARAYDRPDAELTHGRDLVGMARVFDRTGDAGRATRALEAALQKGLDAEQADEALRRLAAGAKRSGDWDRAASIWTDMTEAARPRRLFPFEELAKYYEHRSVPPRPDRALELTRAAIGLVDSGALRPARGRTRALADLAHRASRLERKVG